MTQRTFSERQMAVIAFLTRNEDAQGMPPTWAEVGTATGLSPLQVMGVMHKLRKRGVVRFDVNVSRSTRLVRRVSK